MQLIHRPLTDDEWLHVRAAGNQAYTQSIDSIQADEKIAGTKADEAREEALQEILGESRPFTVFDTNQTKESHLITGPTELDPHVHPDTYMGPASPKAIDANAKRWAHLQSSYTTIDTDSTCHDPVIEIGEDFSEPQEGDSYHSDSAYYGDDNPFL